MNVSTTPGSGGHLEFSTTLGSGGLLISGPGVRFFSLLPLREGLSQISINWTQGAKTSALARATRRGEEAGPEYTLGYFPLRLLGNSVLELAISPSFFRPIFFFFFSFFFLAVERGAEAAFGDTAVPRNYDGPHVAEGLPLRAGGKAWSVSSLGRTQGFSEAAIMESK